MRLLEELTAAGMNETHPATGTFGLDHLTNAMDDAVILPVAGRLDCQSRSNEVQRVRYGRGGHSWRTGHVR